MALRLTLPKPFGGSQIRSLSAPPSPERITLIGAEPNDELYQPLLPWQARLVQLLPGTDLDPLKCKLEIAEITAQEGLGIAADARLQQYEALSVPRSTAQHTASLSCNGVPMKIPLDLAQALRYLRYEDEPRWLWFHQVCINHEDVEEKSAQMDKAFLLQEKASSTIAWLGLPDEASDIVMHAIDMFPDPSVGSSAQLREAVQSFVSRPWFRSIWSRQAVSAAKELTLQCGDYSFQFHQFCRFALKAGVQGTVETLHDDHLGSGKRTLHNYDRTLTDTFFEVLASGAAFETADDRDRIDSSLALIDNIWRKSGRKSFLADLPIDYTMGVQEVFEDVMVFLMNRERSLAILNALGPRDLTGTVSSWSCDWRKTGLFLPADRRDYSGQLPPMHVKDGKLTLIGSFVGTIDQQLDWLAEPAIEACGSPKLRHRRSVSSTSSIPASLNIKKARHRDDHILQLCGSGSYTFRTIKFADGTMSSALGIAAPAEARQGDEIAVMHGCNAPFVLRWTAEGFQVVGACWMSNTFSARAFEDELHHYCDFDSWSQTLYRAECNEPPEEQANIRRALKTVCWHRRYWMQSGQIFGEEEARANNLKHFDDHQDWLKHAQAGNAIREYTLC